MRQSADFSQHQGSKVHYSADKQVSLTLTTWLLLLNKEKGVFVGRHEKK